jgi:hypothetical protein
MELLNVFYCYLSSIFEFFTFRSKPSYIQLTDLENRNDDYEEEINFSHTP